MLTAVTFGAGTLLAGNEIWEKIGSGGRQGLGWYFPGLQSLQEGNQQRRHS